MFLSDRKYLELRANLRELLRDSRDRIEELPDTLKQAADKNIISIDPTDLTKYMNGVDYKRTKEFYERVRNLRQNNTQVPYFGTTYVPKKLEYLILQAETFAKEMKKVRRAA